MNRASGGMQNPRQMTTVGTNYTTKLCQQRLAKVIGPSSAHGGAARVRPSEERFWHILDLANVVLAKNIVQEFVLLHCRTLISQRKRL